MSTTTDLTQQIKALSTKQLVFMLEQIYGDLDTPEFELIARELTAFSTQHQKLLDMSDLDWENDEFSLDDSAEVARLLVASLIKDANLRPLIEKALAETRTDRTQDLGILSIAAGLSLLWLVITAEIKFEYKGLKIHKKGLAEETQGKVIETLGKVADVFATLLG